MLALSLVAALAIDSGLLRFAKVFRLGIFVPYAVPAVVATLMWGYLYGRDFGPFAQLAEKLGMSAPHFLSDGLMLWLDGEHRHLGVHRIQHDHPVRGAARHPARPVRGGRGRRRRGVAGRLEHQAPRAAARRSCSA